MKTENSLPLAGLIVAVDFDGTCVTHEYPRIGRSIGAEPVLRRLILEGARLILWTIRGGEELEDAVQWFADAEIELWGINQNPEQATWSNSSKVYAKLYIDDAALGAPLKAGLQSERPFIDWPRVQEMIWPAESPVAKEPEIKFTREQAASFCNYSEGKGFTRDVLAKIGVSYPLREGWRENKKRELREKFQLSDREIAGADPYAWFPGGGEIKKTVRKKRYRR